MSETPEGEPPITNLCTRQTNGGIMQDKHVKSNSAKERGSNTKGPKNRYTLVKVGEAQKRPKSFSVPTREEHPLEQLNQSTQNMTNIIKRDRSLTKETRKKAPNGDLR